MEQESSHVFLLLEKASEWMDARAGAPTMMSPLEVFLGLFFLLFLRSALRSIGPFGKCSHNVESPRVGASGLTSSSLCPLPTSSEPKWSTLTPCSTHLAAAPLHGK